MKVSMHLIIVLSVVLSWNPHKVSAEDKTVIIPLWTGKKISCDATPPDVLTGKTFTCKDGEQTGVRPPAPLATDHIGHGVQPPQPRYEVRMIPFVVGPQVGYGVKDRLTGLIWRLSPEPAMAFWEAKESCEDLSTQYILELGGRPIGVDDWRLPTIKEMESLIDYGRAAVTIQGSNALAIPNYFTNVLNGEYWTDTYIFWIPCGDDDKDRCGVSYLVDIQDAETRQEVFLAGAEDEPLHYYWCVRGPYGIDY